MFLWTELPTYYAVRHKSVFQNKVSILSPLNDCWPITHSFVTMRLVTMQLVTVHLITMQLVTVHLITM